MCELARVSQVVVMELEDDWGKSVENAATHTELYSDSMHYRTLTVVLRCWGIDTLANLGALYTNLERG